MTGGPNRFKGFIPSVRVILWNSQEKIAVVRCPRHEWIGFPGGTYEVGPVAHKTAAARYVAEQIGCEMKFLSYPRRKRVAGDPMPRFSPFYAQPCNTSDSPMHTWPIIGYTTDPAAARPPFGSAQDASENQGMKQTDGLAIEWYDPTVAFAMMGISRDDVDDPPRWSEDLPCEACGSSQLRDAYFLHDCARQEDWDKVQEAMTEEQRTNVAVLIAWNEKRHIAVIRCPRHEWIGLPNRTFTYDHNGGVDVITAGKEAALQSAREYIGNKVHILDEGGNVDEGGNYVSHEDCWDNGLCIRAHPWEAAGVDAGPYTDDKVEALIAKQNDVREMSDMRSKGPIIDWLRPRAAFDSLVDSIGIPIDELMENPWDPEPPCASCGSSRTRDAYLINSFACVDEEKIDVEKEKIMWEMIKREQEEKGEVETAGSASRDDRGEDAGGGDTEAMDVDSGPAGEMHDQGADETVGQGEDGDGQGEGEDGNVQGAGLKQKPKASTPVPSRFANYETSQSRYGRKTTQGWTDPALGWKPRR